MPHSLPHHNKRGFTHAPSGAGFTHAPSGAGFTLIEIVITTSIISLIVVGIYNFIQQSNLTQTYVSEQSSAIAEARDGIDLFAKELREASDADTGAYPIELATENEIIFYSDVDADALTERIHYYLDSSQLKKGVIEPSGYPIAYSGEEQESIISSYIINDISSPIFTYYNEDYPIDEITNPLSYPADVTSTTLVKINLEVNVTPDRIPDTITVESFVQIRNVKNNFSD